MFNYRYIVKDKPGCYNTNCQKDIYIQMEKEGSDEGGYFNEDGDIMDQFVLSDGFAGDWNSFAGETLSQGSQPPASPGEYRDRVKTT